MNRNKNKDYLKKCRDAAPAGWQFDILNYLYNPSHTYNYPVYKKEVAKGDSHTRYKMVYYFKYAGGSGEYCAQEYDSPNDTDGWTVTTNYKDKVLEEADRFNLNKLLTFL